MACDAATVATDASCFTCKPEKALLGMQVYLLAQLLKLSDPMADISPAAIAAASNCYTCYLSGKGLLGATVYLLCQMIDVGGIAAMQIYTGAAPPAAPNDPTRAAIFYPDGGGAMQEWNVATAAWI